MCAPGAHTRLQMRWLTAHLQLPRLPARPSEGSRRARIRLDPPVAADRISALAVHRAPSSDRPRGTLAWRTAAATPLAALALALGACGSSPSTGNTADPAGVVPATAPLYLGADVRPEGSEKSSALAAGSALTHQADPYLRLLQAIQTPGSPPLDFGRDVAPWLGPHAGVFLDSLGAASALLPLLQQGLLGASSSTGAFPFGKHRAQGAIVLDTRDTGKARAFLEAAATRAGATAATYRGVSYRTTSGGVAFGLVARFAVIGSEAGLRGVVDTTLGAAALAHASGYAKLVAAAPSGALAHLYTNPNGPPAASAAGPSQTGSSGLLALLAGSREANISLVPAQGTLSLYVDARTSAGTSTPGGLLSSGAEGAQQLAELPGDSWLALGLAHLGSTLGQDIVGLRELASLGSTLTGGAPSASASGTLSLKGLLEGLLAPLSALAADSAQARRDFTSWMGSGALFASGSGLLELRGAIVIESKNPAASRAAVSKLAARLRQAGDGIQPASIPGTDAALGARVAGLPLVLYIADGRDAAGHTKFVLGLGESSVTAALAPATTLASAAARSAAASALGEGLQPSLVFQLPTLLSLLEGVGLTEDPTLSKLLPYLRSVTSIDGGGHALASEVERFKLVVGLQGSAG